MLVGNEEHRNKLCLYKVFPNRTKTEYNKIPIYAQIKLE